MIEVTYGETIFHSTEAVREMVAREEWLECWHDASSMFDIPGSTPVWAPYIYIYIYILFFRFSWYKSIYIVLKAICSIKEHWWSLTLSWPNKVQRMFSTAHEFSNKNLNHRRFYNSCYMCALWIKLYYHIIFTGSLDKYSSSTQLCYIS